MALVSQTRKEVFGPTIYHLFVFLAISFARIPIIIVPSPFLRGPPRGPGHTLGRGTLVRRSLHKVKFSARGHMDKQ